LNLCARTKFDRRYFAYGKLRNAAGQQLAAGGKNMLKDALPSVKTDLPGEKAKRWLKRCGESLPDAIMSDYPVVIERGEGAVLEDVDGNVFLDWTGGVGVLNIGH